MMDSFDETFSPSQAEKVQQFSEITGIDDMNRCKDILIRNGWDLEVAMQEVQKNQSIIEVNFFKSMFFVSILFKGDEFTRRTT